jgi:DNA repair exonuclease SbcCD ATPase subunit
VPTLPGVIGRLSALWLNQSRRSACLKKVEKLLDKVSNAREELVTVERTLERLRSDIAKLRKEKRFADSLISPPLCWPYNTSI